MTDRNFPEPINNPLLDNIRIVLVEPQGPFSILFGREEYGFMKKYVRKK